MGASDVNVRNAIYTDVVKESFMGICAEMVRSVKPDEFHNIKRHTLSMPDTHIKSMHVIFLHGIHYSDDECFIRAVIKYRENTMYKVQFVLDSEKHGQYKEIRQTMYYENGKEFNREEVALLANKFASIIQKIIKNEEFDDEDKQNLYINNLIVVAHRLKIDLLEICGHYKDGSLTGVYKIGRVSESDDEVYLVELTFKSGEKKGEITVYRARKTGKVGEYNHKEKLASELSKKMKTKAIIGVIREAAGLE